MGAIANHSGNAIVRAICPPIGVSIGLKRADDNGLLSKKRFFAGLSVKSKLGLLLEGNNVFHGVAPSANQLLCTKLMFTQRRPQRCPTRRTLRPVGRSFDATQSSGASTPSPRSRRFFGKFLGIRRAATATVEVAICLPVLMTLTLATMDLCSLFFLKETVSIAAYEGARRGINRGGTTAAATARVQQILDERGVTYGGDVVTFTGKNYNNAETLEHVTLVVTVPAAGNLLAPAGLYGDLILSSQVTMRKEFENQN